MFIENNKRRVQNGTILTWTMQGSPGRNAGLPIALQIEYVKLPDGRIGVALDPRGTSLPMEITVGSLSANMFSGHGRNVFFRGMSLNFENIDYYFLLIMNIDDDLSCGELYFSIYPPHEFGGGDLVYNIRQYLE